MKRETDIKRLLSELIDNEFKRYIENKVYISDFATGGGKTYNIAHLACSYYLDHFDQIVVLCVQNKLVNGMRDELMKFSGNEDSLVNESDILVVENNANVLVNSIKNRSIFQLLEEIQRYLEDDVELNYESDTFSNLKRLVKNAESVVSECNDEDYDKLASNKEFNEIESQIRRIIKGYVSGNQGGRGSRSRILKDFPTLEKVYPQINLKKSKVLLMTVHKALWGIDLIIDKEVSLLSLENKNGTLFIFDESDQAALSMRDVIISQSIGEKKQYDLFRNFTTYQSMSEDSSISEDFAQRALLMSNMSKVREKLKGNFRKKLKIDRMPNNILLDKREDIESVRNGVFLCGPTFKYDIKPGRSGVYEIVASKGGNHLTMGKSSSKKGGLPLSDFVELICNSTKTIKASLASVMKSIRTSQMENYKKAIENNESGYVLYPTEDNCAHTLVSRFRDSNREIENQLIDFIKNPKNIKTDKGISIEDTSVYMQGMKLYYEMIDDQDILKNVSIFGNEILTTPEKIIIQLVSKPKNAVVLSSATANSESVASNFSIYFLRRILNSRLSRIDAESHKFFERYLRKLHHEDYRVVTDRICGHMFSDSRIDKWEMPEKYSNMFCDEARAEGLDRRWFKATLANLKVSSLYNSDKERVNKIQFQLNRYFKFIETYYKFWNSEDIHSMIYFQNKTGKSKEDRNQVMFLASMIDGSYKRQANFSFDSIDIPELVNDSLLVTNQTSEVRKRVAETVGKDPNLKLMLVTAYNSFKAGENLQYEYPDGTEVLKGDSWSEINEKDWDAVYLEEPTHHFTLNYEDSMDHNQQMFQSLLQLMMYYDDGKLAAKEVYSYLDVILQRRKSYVRSDDKPALAKDKARWVLSILEQSVGRLSRTKNKNRFTHVFYDEGIMKYFCYYDKKKSYTVEFRGLIDDIMNLMENIEQTWLLSEQSERVNMALKANTELDRINRKALWYNTNEEDDYDEEEESDDEDENAYHGHLDVEKYQHVIDDFKQLILRYPTMEEETVLQYPNIGVNICQCYGSWRVDDSEGYDYWRKEGKVCVKESDSTLEIITPQSVRLESMMRNGKIRAYFEKNQFATSWDIRNKLILHPDILQSWYAGEIGEQAFLALMADEVKAEFKKLTGKDYELADFVIQNSKGENLIAFDIKNYDPNIVHSDNTGDMTTGEKRKHKRERLKCRVVTVNILEIEGIQITVDEIGGLINEKGECLTQNIEIIKNMIKEVTR